jgi:hypothetical protein
MQIEQKNYFEKYTLRFNETELYYKRRSFYHHFQQNIPFDQLILNRRIVTRNMDLLGLMVICGIGFALIMAIALVVGGIIIGNFLEDFLWSIPFFIAFAIGGVYALQEYSVKMYLHLATAQLSGYFIINLQNRT